MLLGLQEFLAFLEGRSHVLNVLISQSALVGRVAGGHVAFVAHEEDGVGVADLTVIFCYHHPRIEVCPENVGPPLEGWTQHSSDHRRDVLCSYEPGPTVSTALPLQLEARGNCYDGRGGTERFSRCASLVQKGAEILRSFIGEKCEVSMSGLAQFGSDNYHRRYLLEARMLRLDYELRKITDC